MYYKRLCIIQCISKLYFCSADKLSISYNLSVWPAHFRSCTLIHTSGRVSNFITHCILNTSLLYLILSFTPCCTSLSPSLFEPLDIRNKVDYIISDSPIRYGCLPNPARIAVRYLSTKNFRCTFKCFSPHCHVVLETIKLREYGKPKISSPQLNVPLTSASSSLPYAIGDEERVRSINSGFTVRLCLSASGELSC